MYVCMYVCALDTDSACVSSAYMCVCMCVVYVCMYVCVLNIDSACVSSANVCMSVASVL